METPSAFDAVFLRPRPCACRPLSRRMVVGTLALLLCPALASCASKPDPKTSPTPTASVETDADRYHAALARFTAYEKASESIWARGKYTPAAKELIGQYWQTTGPDVVPATYQEVADARLRQADTNEIQIEGLPKLLSSRPVSVTAHRVIVEQCVDHRGQVVRQHGKRLKNSAQGPITQRIILVRSGREPWSISSLNDNPEDNHSCAS